MCSPYIPHANCSVRILCVCTLSIAFHLIAVFVDSSSILLFVCGTLNGDAGISDCMAAEF
jgi:hypothetical protein